ncbi:DUF4942 domain-containing protein, partial [Citrobacter portucalensis]
VVGLYYISETEQNAQPDTRRNSGWIYSMTTELNQDVKCEFVTGSEVIPSVSIDLIITQRNYALDVYQQGLDMIHQAHKLMKEVSKEKLYIFKEIARNGVDHDDSTYSANRMKRALDAGIWQRLMNDTGMKTLMSHQQINEWDKQLDSKDMPEVTRDNVIASFTALHENKADMFEKGVVDLFKKLSWDYKTNCPCKLGEKIIVNYMVGSSYNVSWTPTDEGRNKLNDLEKMMCVLDGKNVPDHRIAAGEKFYNFTQVNQWSGEKYEHEYFSVKYFKKGSGHIHFKRSDLVERLNEIISKAFPNAIASRV